MLDKLEDFVFDFIDKYETQLARLGTFVLGVWLFSIGTSLVLSFFLGADFLVATLICLIFIPLTFIVLGLMLLLLFGVSIILILNGLGIIKI